MWLFSSHSMWWLTLYIWTYIYFIQFVMDFINDYCNQLLNKSFVFICVLFITPDSSLWHYINIWLYNLSNWFFFLTLDSRKARNIVLISEPNYRHVNRQTEVRTLFALSLHLMKWLEQRHQIWIIQCIKVTFVSE